MTPDVKMRWGTAPTPGEYDAAAPAGSAAEGHDMPASGAEWGVATVGGVPVARLAMYLREELTGAPGVTGLVGHYAARDGAAGATLLRAAALRLRDRDAQRVIGPMNGSTWGRYRLALPAQGGDPAEPHYLGEPANPPAYCEQFAAAGFHAVAAYESRISYDLGIANPGVTQGEARLASRGIAIAPLDLTRFDEELHDLHALTARAFADNRYYSPIDAPAFDALYRPMRSLIDPGLVLLARAPGGALIGYVFAYVDPHGLRSGRPYRLVVKTLATHPDWRSLGLGGVLVSRLHAAARARNLGAIIHALMHAANDSVKISSHTARVFRRYALYEHAGA